MPDQDPKSLSPSGAEPHNSYGVDSSKEGSKSNDNVIADDPTYNQPKSSKPSPNKSQSSKPDEKVIADDPTYNQPTGPSEDNGTKKPADSRSKL